MHIYKSRFLVRGEVWFDHEPDQTPVDWIFYHQRRQPVPGARWKYFHTMVLDLSRSPEALLAGLNNTTAYHVRRARERDKVTCDCPSSVSRELLDQFEEAYKAFATTKGLPPLDRPFLDQLAKDGCLELSFARSSEGELLAYHSYYRDSSRSCLLQTFSLYRLVSSSTSRNALSRANRYLFWCDILRHQEQGLKIFDFGGWYPGNTDHDLLEINRFKEGFGGKIVREYNCEQIVSLKGWVVLSMAALLNRAKGLPGKLRFGRRVRGAEPGATETEVPPTTPSSQPEAPALQKVGLAQ